MVGNSIMDKDGFVRVESKKRGKKVNTHHGSHGNVSITTKNKSKNGKFNSSILQTIISSSDSSINDHNLESLALSIKTLRERFMGSEFYRVFMNDFEKRIIPQICRLHELYDDEEDDDNTTENNINKDNKIHVELICYGLGSIVSSVISKYQFILLTILRDQLKQYSQQSPSSTFTVSDNIQIFDPAFTPLDITYFESNNFSVITQNTRGHHTLPSTTPNTIHLFYLPHCGHKLYSNLLRTNWDPALLKRMVLLGNSFDLYRLRDVGCELKRRAEYLWKCFDFFLEGEDTDKDNNNKEKKSTKARKSTIVTKPKRQPRGIKLIEIPIPEFKLLESAFNDMSWHFFVQTSKMGIKSAQDEDNSNVGNHEFWTRPPPLSDGAFEQEDEDDPELM